MIGCLVWCVLILVITACIMPWWYLPLIIVGTIISQLLLHSYYNIQRNIPKKSKSHLERRKRGNVQQKRTGAEGGRKNNHSNANGKKSNVVNNTAAVVGGAALYHHVKKHYRHNGAKNVINDYVDTLDDDLYDTDDVQYYDDTAAYDDYIASMDDD